MKIKKDYKRQTMKILITGANGFIGKSIGFYYSKNGYDVVGIDVCRGNQDGSFEMLEYDLLNANWIELLESIKPNVIIHCAGLASVPFSVEQPELDYEVNTTMVHHLLFAMKTLEMKDVKVIFFSSAGVYGQPHNLPIKEETPSGPLSPYALHKKMSEDICDYFIRNYDFNIEIIRVFSAYGPGLKKQIFWDMHQKVLMTGKLDMWGTGNETRDYIYIDDLVRAVDLIVQNSVYRNLIWNVANGEEVSIRKIANIFIRELGQDESLIRFNNVVREGEPLNWRADISRLKEIGYRQTVTIEEGIRNYIQWINEEKMINM